ncbi:hypothetical protein EJ131_18045 [Bacillus mycoides]|nr:hypothetical protein [Bacillus mycoides]
MKKVDDHPIEDFYGVEIRKDDTYYMFGQDVVLEHNLKMYLIEKYEVPCFQAQ